MDRAAKNAQIRAWRLVNGSEHERKRRVGLKGPFTESDGEDWQAKNVAVFRQNKSAQTNRRRREIFAEALEKYGGARCYCCGETELLLLGLDHIHGGGTKERQMQHNRRTYEIAKRAGWPPLYRVACHSCNLGAHLNGGICPHRKGG